MDEDNFQEEDEVQNSQRYNELSFSENNFVKPVEKVIEKQKPFE